MCISAPSNQRDVFSCGVFKWAKTTSRTALLSGLTLAMGDARRSLMRADSLLERIEYKKNAPIKRQGFYYIAIKVTHMAILGIGMINASQRF